MHDPQDTNPSGDTPDVDFDSQKASDFGVWDANPFLEKPFWNETTSDMEAEELEADSLSAQPFLESVVPRRSWLREPFCGVSHLLGAAASVVACILLLRLAAGQPALVTLGATLYGVSLIALFLASGVYHSFHGTPDRIAFLQRLDLSAIFLLIAGTFAPLCLITLHGPLGWVLLTVEYTLALTGVVLVLCRLPFPAPLRVGMYLIMGWLSLLVLGPLQAALPAAGVAWYVGGGLLYTLGTVIFATDRPHLVPGRFSAHDLWHLFVLSGSLCHFILIYHYVMPATLHRLP